MHWPTHKQAMEYLKHHPFRDRLKVVKTTYLDLDEWEYVPCYTVVMIANTKTKPTRKAS